MTKEEIQQVVEEYIRDNLDITINLGTSSQYMYGGGYEDVLTVEVELFLNGKSIARYKS